MPKPKLYHHFLRARITREQHQAVKTYAKQHGLRWGEAVRDRIKAGLNRDSDVQKAYDEGYADGEEVGSHHSGWEV